MLIKTLSAGKSCIKNFVLPNDNFQEIIISPKTS